MECLLISAMNSQHGKENKPPNKRCWYQSLRKSLSKQVCSVNSCIPAKDPRNAKLCLDKIDIAKSRLAQKQFCEAEIASSDATGCQSNQVGQSAPANNTEVKHKVVASYSLKSRASQTVRCSDGDSRVHQIRRHHLSGTTTTPSCRSIMTTICPLQIEASTSCSVDYNLVTASDHVTLNRAVNDAVLHGFMRGNDENRDGECHEVRRRWNDDDNHQRTTRRTYYEHHTSTWQTRQQRFRRQKRFIGYMTVRRVMNDDGVQVEQLHRVQRRKSFDETVSTANAEIDSRLDRGFLVPADSSFDQDDFRVIAEPIRRRDCRWNPDISPIRRYPSFSAAKVDDVLYDVPDRLPRPRTPVEVDRHSERSRRHDVNDADSGCRHRSRNSRLPTTSLIADHQFLTMKQTNVAESPTSDDCCPCKLVQDLVECEASFARQMSLGAERFSRPLRHSRRISFETWSTVFQNIEKLSALSEYHLQHLLKRNSCLGRSSAILSDHLKHNTGVVYQPTVQLLVEAYHRYKTGLPAALEFVQQLEITSDAEALQQIEDVDDFGLEQFLNRPVNHLFQVHQRLVSLFKSMTGESEDRKALQFVIQEMNRELRSWN